MISCTNNTSHLVSKKTRPRWRLFRPLIAVAILATIPLSLHAKPNDTALTLNAAVKLTLAQNPSLKMFQFRDEGLLARINTARLKPAVELGIDIENVAGSGEFGGIDGADLTVSLSSVIEFGGKAGAREGVVASHRSKLQAQKQVESLELLADVTYRYIDVLAAQERVALANQTTKLANETLRIVRQRAQAGATPDAEVKRAKAAAAQAKLTSATEQQHLDYLKVTLCAMWGDLSPAFSRVEGDLYELTDMIDFETLYDRVQQNPAIQMYASEARIKDAEIRLAKTESATHLRWSIGVRQLQNSDDSAMTVGFSVPLFSSKRNRGAVVSAIAERNEVEIQKNSTLLALHQQLYRAYSNRQLSTLTVKTLKQEVIPALKLALVDTQAAYQRGRYSYLDYVTAHQELLQAQRTVIDAAHAALKYGAEIEQLTAEPLTLDK